MQTGQMLTSRVACPKDNSIRTPASTSMPTIKPINEIAAIIYKMILISGVKYA